MDIYCLVWIESSLFTGIYSESWLLSWKDWFKYKFLPNLLIFSQKLSLSKVAAGKWHPNILWVSMVSIYFWQKDDVMYQITHGILIDFLPACVFYLYITSPGHRRSKCIQIVQKEQHLFISLWSVFSWVLGRSANWEIGRSRLGQVRSMHVLTASSIMSPEAQEQHPESSLWKYAAAGHRALQNQRPSSAHSLGLSI